MSIAYLGPPGSFTQAALPGLGVPPDQAVPYPTVRQALDAVRTGHANAAVVPWENSVEGSVTESVDALTSGRDLRIVGETLLRVQFALGIPTHTPNGAPHAAPDSPGSTPAGAPDTEADTAPAWLEPVRQVLTHPIAHAQCRTWLGTNLPHADIITTASTAQAAKEVGTTTTPGTAAIASPNTLRRYGLHIIANNIGDRHDAITRFVKITRPATTTDTPPTGTDRTSLIVPLADKMQHLHTVLHEFARSHVPLTAVLSRPGGHGLGTYSFLLECEGHINDPHLNTVITHLTHHHHAYHLGSYPRADLNHHTHTT